MGIKKFIKSVKYTLGLNDYKIEGKKKALKDLLRKLNERKKVLKKSLNKSLNNKKEKALKEEFDIVCLQIKKGKKMLHALYMAKNKDKK